ncbi:Uncharacterised protein [uncultured archaeon]|nr:Uncharacterised protein [uncultured archaeon]
MKANVGTIDRVARIILGFALIAFGVRQGGTLGLLLEVVGVVFLFTAITAYCLLYQLLGICTCPKEAGAKKPAAKK